MDKRKSHNQNKEIIFGGLGIGAVVINLMGVYLFHIIGIIFGFYVIVMVRRDKEHGLMPSKLGRVLGWISLILGVAVIMYGDVYELQGV